MIEYEWCNNCHDTTPHLTYFEDGTIKEKCTKCGLINQ